MSSHRPVTKENARSNSWPGHECVKLYSYIVVHDAGLAPNPFYGWCTLAVCTPNHMGVKVTKGD